MFLTRNSTQGDLIEMYDYLTEAQWDKGVLSSQSMPALWELQYESSGRNISVESTKSLGKRENNNDLTTI